MDGHFIKVIGGDFRRNDYACIRLGKLLINKGRFGVRKYKFGPGDIASVEVVHRDGGDAQIGKRVAYAATGALIAGPIGLAAAAFGGRKAMETLRITFNDGRTAILQARGDDAARLFAMTL